MLIRNEVYGALPDGRPVSRHHLSHESGIELSVLDYGAVVTGLWIPDAAGRKGDICPGPASLADLLASGACFGALVGRVAGRVSDAVFRQYPLLLRLSCNEPPNHLHGGFNGFHQKLWRVEEFGEDAEGPLLRMSLRSPAGEEGYPGNLDASVTYRLTANRTFRVEIEARTDEATPFAPTHHGYFNLSAGGEPAVDEHFLWIDADAFVPFDESFRLQGRMDAVVAGSNDFRQTVRLGDVIRGALPTHGNMYVLGAGRRTTPQTVARVTHPASGRQMEVATTEPCLQFYTGMFLDRETVSGKDGAPFPAYGALCLECQGYPDSPFTGMASSVLEPGRTFQSVTEYRFG